MVKDFLALIQWEDNLIENTEFKLMEEDFLADDLEWSGAIFNVRDCIYNQIF
jgi:hypothetical protein